MKKTFALICCFSVILGCANPDEVKMDDRLEEKIQLIIDSYQEEVSDSSKNLFDPPIYEVSFSERGGQCFLTVNTSYFYRTDLDGFTFIKNKLVAFYNVDSRCNENLIEISTKKDDKVLDDFQNEEEAFDNYSPAWWEFKLQEDKLLVTNQGKHEINFK
ncbi:hypothetical protein LB467_12735 [Salegentibacter sp. JZCK2]|uniref:hypothetical protein n=1 Tax=Salegentibacter tibetensis TaxID=2873600 RepID=UPI001CCECDEF|nr:hypothetical protein [Salegentibacter tibetensis]MBZ9730553.1 hypothetical protein [Salegentibacter tibetensis]